MKKLLKQIEFYILLMIFWIILNGQIDIKTIAYGLVFSLVILLVTYKVVFEFDHHILRLPSVWRFFWFGAIVFIEIIKSAILNVVRIIKSETEYKDFEIELDIDNDVIVTIIANAITITPGTITMEVTDKRLKVLGFAKDHKHVEKLKESILSYQKPFI